MSRWIVTFKHAKQEHHDPKHKQIGGCPNSSFCTDSTGEHHSVIVEGDIGIENIKAEFPDVHITRIELAETVRV